MSWNKQTRRRFYEKVKPVGDCLEWTGYIDKNGYGRSSAKSFGYGTAHRAIYIEAHGVTDLVIDHLCGNRKCVKLSHLEAVTQQENVHRSSVTERTNTHCKHGHELSEDNLLWWHGYSKCRQCDRDNKKTPRYRAQARERMQRYRQALRINLGANI